MSLAQIYGHVPEHIAFLLQNNYLTLMLDQNAHNCCNSMENLEALQATIGLKFWDCFMVTNRSVLSQIYGCLFQTHIMLIYVVV